MESELLLEANDESRIVLGLRGAGARLFAAADEREYEMEREDSREWKRAPSRDAVQPMGRSEGA